MDNDPLKKIWQQVISWTVAWIWIIPHQQ